MGCHFCIKGCAEKGSELGSKQTYQEKMTKPKALQRNTDFKNKEPWRGQVGIAAAAKPLTAWAEKEHLMGFRKATWVTSNGQIQTRQ